MLNEDDIDALFVACEIQPFNVSEEALQQIIDHNIWVAQRDLEKEVASTSTMNDQPDQECVQQYQRRSISDGKSKTPQGKLYLPMNPKPAAVPSTSQSQENVSKLVCSALSKTMVQVLPLDLIQLAHCQEQVVEHMRLSQAIEVGD